MKKIIGIALLATLALNVQAKKYVKTVVFPEGATIEQKVDMAACLVPSKRQMEWQKLELTAFLHFGMNTFTNREWGEGNEDPQLFNPTHLDCDQWVSTLKAAGFKMVILTAKHHDGFCLWPTATTRHSVEFTPWKDGKGDVVRELREACNKYDMKMGVYLSPWDRNADCYGDSERYNNMFVAQLTELLSNYGCIDEVWFDGACGEGPNGRRQEYDWQRFADVIHTLQPDAVTAIMGDDVRWVGNERGEGRTTEWCATAITPGIYPDAATRNKSLGLVPKSPDLGGREILAKTDRLYWWPSEVDVSVRKGWFYHANEDPKSLSQLANIYLTSVGRNSVLLLNVPPDTEGRIHSTDSVRLMELRRWIDASFTHNYVTKKKGNVYRLEGNNSRINAVTLGEDISKGQRIEAFTVDAQLLDGSWKQVAQGTTVGFKRILTFDAIDAQALRVNINQYRGKKYHLRSVEANCMQEINETSGDAHSHLAIDKKGWKVLSNNPSAQLMIDGDASTAMAMQVEQFPAEVVIDLGAQHKIGGLAYTPDKDARGAIFHYAVSVSTDGVNYTPCDVTGEFGNIVNNPVTQVEMFKDGKAVEARYFKLTVKSSANGEPTILIPEITLFTSK